MVVGALVSRRGAEGTVNVSEGGGRNRCGVKREGRADLVSGGKRGREGETTHQSTAYEMNKVCEISFSKIGTAVLDVRAASVMAVGELCV
jgi:hypothetical protein